MEEMTYEEFQEYRRQDRTGKIHVYVAILVSGNINNLIDTRRAFQKSTKAWRKKLGGYTEFDDTYFVDTCTFEELEQKYMEGAGEFEYTSYGGGAYLTREQIDTIVGWDTNCLVFDMETGKEY